MNITKIFLYDEPSVPEIRIEKLANFITETFAIKAEIRNNIFEHLTNTQATKLASCRIFDTRKPFELHSPTDEEIEYEMSTSKNSENKDNIMMYDGFEVQNEVSDLISMNEMISENLHVVFTNKLTCTYDYNDYRYHGRAIICTNPTIISTTGIIEAPAKPREYYMELIAKMNQGLNVKSLKEKYHGTFLDYHDKRISTIVEGYFLQSLFYYYTGEPFCSSRECRLFNPHWQKDLIYSQIESGKFCEKHQAALQSLINLN